MKSNFFTNLLGAVLALVALTGVVAIGVKLGNNGLKESIKDWKDEIKDLTSEDTSSGPSSSTPSPSSSSESTSSSSASGALVVESPDLHYYIEN